MKSPRNITLRLLIILFLTCSIVPWKTAFATPVSPLLSRVGYINNYDNQAQSTFGLSDMKNAQGVYYALLETPVAKTSYYFADVLVTSGNTTRAYGIPLRADPGQSLLYFGTNTNEVMFTNNGGSPWYYNPNSNISFNPLNDSSSIAIYPTEGPVTEVADLNQNYMSWNYLPYVGETNGQEFFPIQYYNNVDGVCSWPIYWNKGDYINQGTILRYLANLSSELRNDVVVSTYTDAQKISSNAVWTTQQSDAALLNAITVANAVDVSNPASSNVLTATAKLANSYYDFYSNIQSGRQFPLRSVPAYQDVPVDSWFAEYVQAACARYLMNGYNNSFFGPDDGLTRGQLALILYRYGYVGTQETYYAGRYPLNSFFNDVRYDQGELFFAVSWVSNTGVMTGYEGTNIFGANDPVTREQLATIIYRFDTERGGISTIGNAYSSFASHPDASDVSAWAIQGFGWAVYHGLISGYEPEGILAPRNNVTRAQLAKIIAVGFGELIGW